MERSNRLESQCSLLHLLLLLFSTRYRWYRDLRQPDWYKFRVWVLNCSRLYLGIQRLEDMDYLQYLRYCTFHSSTLNPQAHTSYCLIHPISNISRFLRASLLAQTHFASTSLEAEILILKIRPLESASIPHYKY